MTDPTRVDEPATAPAAHPGPDWVRHAIWWHVYPLGAVGADTTGADRGRGDGLARLVGYLDHLVALGCSGLALGPVFASETHGYDTVDHLRVDERLGDEHDLTALIDAAHERGVRVMLDGVFDHVGRSFGPFRAAVEDPSAASAGMFRRDGAGEPIGFEGHDALVMLDPDSDDVADLVVDVMSYWCDRGVDAWRLDAAYAVPEAFWARVLPRVRERHPDVYVMGEVLHGDYARIVADSGMDAVTQYELWKAIRSSLDERNLFELAWSLDRHDGMLDEFVPYTFVGNHDVTRLASAVDDGRHRAHAVVVLLTVGGTPSVYYGDELGMTGVKEERIGGDDAVRPELPADRSGLVDDGSFPLHQELIGLRRRNPWLHGARTDVALLENERIVYDAVGAAGERLRVALNLADAPLEAAASGDVVAGSAHVADGRVVVPPHGWAVLG